MYICVWGGARAGAGGGRVEGYMEEVSVIKQALAGLKYILVTS